MEKENHYKKTAQFHRKAALKKNGFYDGIATKLSHHPIQLWVRKTIFRLLEPIYKKGVKILDAGCGRGDFSLEIAQRFSNSQVVGLDCVNEMLEIGKRIAKNQNNISSIKADLLNVPLPDNSFDITICNNTLHHIHKDDQEKALNELTRVTKKYLILEIKNKKNVYNLIQKKKVGNLIVYPTTIKKIKNILEKHNFKLIKSKKILYFTILSPWIVLKFKKYA